MTDETIIAIVGAAVGAGGLGGALKWAVSRIVKSNDAGTAALVEIKSSNAVLVVKNDELRAELRDELRETRAELRETRHELREVNAFVRKHATQPPQNKRAETLGRGADRRAQTPGRGVAVRRGTHPNGDDE